MTVWLLVAPALALAVLAGACSPAAPRDARNGIEVTGEGRVAFTHDALRLVVVAGGRGATPDAAAKVAAANFDAMRAALAGAGVGDGDVVASDLSVQPLGNAGYTAGRRFVVFLRALSTASATLERLATSPPEPRYCSWTEFRYVVSQDLTDRARSAANADARTQAASIAQATGVRVGKVISVRESARRAPSTPGIPSPPFSAAGARSVRLTLSQPRAPATESLVSLVVRFEIDG